MLWIHQPSSRRVQMNIITDDFPILRLFFVDDHRFVTPLKHMPDLPMPRVESCRVGRLEPLHARHQIPDRSLKQQMVVIAHQHIALNHESASPAHLAHRLKKNLPISFIMKNRLPPIPSAHHMIAGSLILNPW